MQVGGGDVQVRDPGAGGQHAQESDPGDGTPIRGVSGSLDMLGAPSCCPHPAEGEALPVGTFPV